MMALFASSLNCVIMWYVSKYYEQNSQLMALALQMKSTNTKHERVMPTSLNKNFEDRAE